MKKHFFLLIISSMAFLFLALFQASNIYATIVNDTFTKLYLNMESDSFIDESQSSHSLLQNSGILTSTASTASGMGVSSAYSRGSGTYLKYGASEDWNFGTGPFAIDTMLHITGEPNGVIPIVSKSTLGRVTSSLSSIVDTGKPTLLVKYRLADHYLMWGWTLHGSNSGSFLGEEVLLSSISAHSNGTHSAEVFDVNATVPYRYYKLTYGGGHGAGAYINTGSFIINNRMFGRVNSSLSSILDAKESVFLSKYVMGNHTDMYGWNIYGSNTGVFGSEKVLLASVAGHATGVHSTEEVYEVNASIPYRYYKIEYGGGHSGSANIQEGTQIIELTSVTGTGVIAGTVGNPGWNLFYEGDKFKFKYLDSSNVKKIDISASYTGNLSTFNHFAITRDSSSNIRMFFNGNQLGSTFNSSQDINTGTSDLYIMGTSANPNLSFTGFLDAFRITKGIPRWTSNFIPPRPRIVANFASTYDGVPRKSCARFYSEIPNAVTGIYELDPDEDGQGFIETTCNMSASDLPPRGNLITLTTKSFNSKNELNWNTVTGASTYNIYYSTTPGVTKLNGTKISGVIGNKFIHRNLTNNTAYYYIMTAITQGGEEGSPSGEISAVPGINLSPSYDGVIRKSCLEHFQEIPNSQSGIYTINYGANGNESDSYTKLLLKFDNSYTIDYSLYKKQVLRLEFNTPTYANFYYDKQYSINHKFGNSELFHNNLGVNYLSNDSDDFYFGTGSFTIDFWFKYNANQGGFFTQSGSGSDNYLTFGLAPGGIPQFIVKNNSQYITNISQLTANDWVYGNWYHVALVGSGNIVNIYRNGISIASGSITGEIPNFNGSINIGKDISGNYIRGFMDEFRISKGIARWTSDFTPPTSEYDSAGRNPVDVYCDMSSDGGGWTLVLADTDKQSNDNRQYNFAAGYLTSTGWGLNGSLYRPLMEQDIHKINGQGLRITDTGSNVFYAKSSSGLYFNGINYLLCKISLDNQWTNYFNGGWGISNLCQPSFIKTGGPPWTYTYAYSFYGDSGYGNTYGGARGVRWWARALPIPGGSPNITYSSGRSDSVLLKWYYSYVNKYEISKYNVYFSTTPGITKTGSNINKIEGIVGTTYHHKWLIPGITYYYRISAINNEGESNLGPEVFVVIGSDISPSYDGVIRSSCADHYYSINNAQDGMYPIDPDGPGLEDLIDVYCDMTTDGGGWTLLMNDKQISANDGRTLDSLTGYISSDGGSLDGAFYKAMNSSNISKISGDNFRIIKGDGSKVFWKINYIAGYSYYSGTGNYSCKSTINGTWLSKIYPSGYKGFYTESTCGFAYNFSNSTATSGGTNGLKIYSRPAKCDTIQSHCNTSRFSVLDDNNLLYGADSSLKIINKYSAERTQINIPGFNDITVKNDTTIYSASGSQIKEINITTGAIISTIGSTSTGDYASGSIATALFTNITKLIYDKGRNAIYFYDKGANKIKKINFINNEVINLVDFNKTKNKLSFGLNIASGIVTDPNIALLTDGDYQKVFSHLSDWVGPKILGSTGSNTYTKIEFNFSTDKKIYKIHFLNKRADSHQCSLDVKGYSWINSSWNQVYLFNGNNEWISGYNDENAGNEFNYGRNANIVFDAPPITSKIKIEISSNNQDCAMTTDEIVVYGDEASSITPIKEFNAMDISNNYIYLSTEDEVYKYHIGLGILDKIAGLSGGGFQVSNQVGEIPLSSARFFYIKDLYSQKDGQGKDVIYVVDTKGIRKIDESAGTGGIIKMLNKSFVTKEGYEYLFRNILPESNANNFYFFDEKDKFRKVRFSNTTGENDFVSPSSITGFTVTQTGTTNDIIFTWLASGDDGQSGAGEAYQIVYSTNPGTIIDGGYGPLQEIEQRIIPKEFGTQETLISDQVFSTGVTMYFGIREYDDSGNVSPFTTGSLVIGNQASLSAQIDGTIKDTNAQTKSGVEVMLFSQIANFYKKTISNSEGLFSFTGALPQIDYRIKTNIRNSGTGFDSYDDGSSDNNEYYSSTYTGNDILLLSAGSITGKITSSTGSNLSGAVVRAFNNQITGYKASNIGITDSSGNFSIPNLRAGETYYIFINMKGFPLKTLTDTFIATSNGTDIGTVQLSSGYNISGKFLNTDGTEFTNEFITLTKGTTIKEFKTNGSGDYLFSGIEPGTYTVSLKNTMYKLDSSQSSISINADIVNYDLTVSSTEQPIKILLYSSTGGLLSNQYNESGETVVSYSYDAMVTGGGLVCFGATFTSYPNDGIILVNGVPGGETCEFMINVEGYGYATTKVKIPSSPTDFYIHKSTMQPGVFENNLFASTEQASPGTTIKFTGLLENKTAKNLSGSTLKIKVDDNIILQDLFIGNTKKTNLVPDIEGNVSITIPSFPSGSSGSIIYIAQVKNEIFGNAYVTAKVEIVDGNDTYIIGYKTIPISPVSLDLNQTVAGPGEDFAVFGKTIPNKGTLEIVMQDMATNAETILKRVTPSDVYYNYIVNAPQTAGKYVIFARLIYGTMEFTSDAYYFQVIEGMPEIDRTEYVTDNFTGDDGIAKRTQSLSASYGKNYRGSRNIMRMPSIDGTPVEIRIFFKDGKFPSDLSVYSFEHNGELKTFKKGKGVATSNKFRTPENGFNTNIYTGGTAIELPAQDYIYSKIFILPPKKSNEEMLSLGIGATGGSSSKNSKGIGSLKSLGNEVRVEFNTR